jgi:hypothetical protein
MKMSTKEFISEAVPKHKCIHQCVMLKCFFESTLPLAHRVKMGSGLKTSNLEQPSHWPIRHSNGVDLPPEDCFKLTGWP